MFFAKSFVATVALSASVEAHMKLSSPKPYSPDSANNSPLEASGSNFPCKIPAGGYTGSSNVYPLGSTQQLSLIGSAVHGGGSCQISLTYDNPPTKNSKWKVIHSIIGGCPAKGVDGNLPENAAAPAPDSYPFTIPKDIPAGNVSISWTWNNRVGNREQYMQCGAVSLTGDGGDKAAFDALPDMFIANIPSVNSCTTKAGTDVRYPNPGKSVAYGNGESDPNIADPEGDCGASGGGNGSGSPTSSISAPAATSPATPSAPAATSIPGGVFITVPTVRPSSTAASAPTSTPAPVPSPTPGSGSGSTAGTLTGACQEEGAWNCIAGTSFQRCSSGQWSAVLSMAAGTKCTAGQSSTLAMAVSGGAKREVRAFRA